MSVNAVNFRSQMAAQPLRSNQHVSFAARKENAEQTEAPKKSNTGKWIAAGATLAAVAAAVVFRKDISKFIKNINLGPVKDTVIKTADKVKDLGKTAMDKAKDIAGKINVDGMKTAVSGFGAKVANVFKKGWSAIKTGVTFVKDLCVKVAKWVAGLFAKPKAPVTNPALLLKP